MRSAIGVLLPIVKETMQCRRTSSAAARNCAAHWVLLGFAIFAGGEVTPGMFVPVLVALAQLGVHHIRRNNEDAAIVGRIWVGKPNEHREVGSRVAFEQRCPVRAAHRPLCSRRSVSRRFYGKSDLSRAPHAKRSMARAFTIPPVLTWPRPTRNQTPARGKRFRPLLQFPVQCN